MSYTYNWSSRGILEKVPTAVEYRRVIGTEYEEMFTSNTGYCNLNDFLNKFEEEIQIEPSSLIKRVHHKYAQNNKVSYLSEIIYIDTYRQRVFGISITGFDYLDEDECMPSYDDASNEKQQEELERLKNGEVGIKVEALCTNADAVNVKEILEKVLPKEKYTKKKREINIILKNDYGLYLQGFPTSEIDIDIEANYNDGFKEVSDSIIEQLNNNNRTGLVLLSGIPGSGKTSYIRHLSAVVDNKTIIYIPPDTSNIIADPEFLSFMIKYRNSILLIEDAENILKTRKAGGNQSISNILNLSDGLLGDCLKLQIICTFNCPYNEIDEALKREGRLIAEYKFEKLSKDKSQKLLRKIYSDENITIKEPMTLAEIFNFKKKHYVNIESDNVIGFKK